MEKQYTENEKKVVSFLQMLQDRKSSDELDQYFHPEIQQKEFPNAITTNTATRNLEELKLGAEKGQKILSREEYEITNLYSVGEVVILEAVWKGAVSMPIGNIPVGGKMVAYFAQFFEFKDGKIYRQRNYDCFEPFW